MPRICISSLEYSALKILPALSAENWLERDKKVFPLGEENSNVLGLENHN